MNPPVLLLATFLSSFIPDCMVSTWTGQCDVFGLVSLLDYWSMHKFFSSKANGELRTSVKWKCFPNNTILYCSTKIEDCSKCDGRFDNRFQLALGR